MLFWKFFFGLFIADLIFTFAWLTYNGLVVMATVALFANREDHGNAEAEKPPIKRRMLFVLSSPFLIFAGVYIVVGWAAFVARYASACSQTPGVEQHWLYYLFGFGCVGSALIAGESKGEKDWRKYIAAVAYVIFAFSPTLAEWPYGWAIDRVLGSPAASVSPADEAIDRGREAAAKEDWGSAVTEYTNAIRLDPKRADAWCGLGEAYGEKREWSKAIANLSEAIRLNPEYVRAYFQRGCAHLGKGCPSSVFEKNGTSVGGLVGAAAWGFLGLGKADFNRAIADFTEAIRLKPDCAEAYYCRGTAYGMQGEKDKADADLAEARRLGYKP
jgi:tetratricopeptide (TPR) repeat protein